MQDATTRSVDAVREVGEAIGRMDGVASAIAAAVEQQDAATREISQSVQTVSRQTEDAKRLMMNVSEVADDAGRTSQDVMHVAEEVAQVSASLRTEVEEFLAAMRGGNSQRRRYERIPGGGMMAVMKLRDGTSVPSEVKDISRGGTAIACNAAVEAGMDVLMTLPDAGGDVAGRIARIANGVLAITFRQDPTTLERIDRVLEALDPSSKSARAA
jgi:methyl-accepting chemotaxis protein